MRHFPAVRIRPINMLGLLMAAVLAGCTVGSHNNLSALIQNEKTAFRKNFAARIGATPTEVTYAFDKSLETERQAAALVTHKLVRQQGLSDDVEMQKYLQQMVDKLTSGLGSENFQYKVYLLDDERVNAFTPGGGTILVKEGLVTYCDNEAQMAAVLAHEIAHIVMRHPNRMRRIEIAKKTGGSLMDSITPEGLKDNLGRLLRLGGRATVNGFVRSQEAEADSVGIDIMVAAGYDPHGMAEIQRQLRQFAPRISKLAHAIYGNHPLSDERELAALVKIDELYPDVKGIQNTKKFARLAAKYQEKRKESPDKLGLPEYQEVSAPGSQKPAKAQGKGGKKKL
jgi:predicted Zn-dependent protease